MHLCVAKYLRPLVFIHIFVIIVYGFLSLNLFMILLFFMKISIYVHLLLLPVFYAGWGSTGWNTTPKNMYPIPTSYIFYRCVIITDYPWLDLKMILWSICRKSLYLHQLSWSFWISWFDILFFPWYCPEDLKLKHTPLWLCNLEWYIYISAIFLEGNAFNEYLYGTLLEDWEEIGMIMSVAIKQHTSHHCWPLLAQPANWLWHDLAVSIPHDPSL